METKVIDQNGLRSFQQCYRMCCKSENIIPLKNLTLKNNGHSLDFCVDRIKYLDWAPIFIALSDDLSLHCVAVRCRTQAKTILEQVDCERLAKNITRSPVILTKFMLTNLIDSITQCVSQSSVIFMLQIEGLPLFVPYIDPIAKALSLNHSLKHISFHGCLIGDSGCHKVCDALRTAHNVVTLNLSACNLTSQGATHIAELINFLKIYRYSENWKQTLRYRNPDLDSMAGLRRITLSDNPEFGDSGFLHLIEVLLDDLWIKALDLQQCGLSESVVKNCLQLLELNATIRVLDMRYNSNVSMKSIGNICAVLKKNESNSALDNSWITVSSTSLIHKDQKFPPKNKPSKKKDKQNTVQLLRNEENRTLNELIHVNSLKEQLKQEIEHRKQLEELNKRLLQQVKELKVQQIMQWKTPVLRGTMGVNKSRNIILNESKTNKQKECNNNNRRLNDATKQHFMCRSAELKNSPDSSIEMRDLNVENFQHAIYSGADILEHLIERRHSSKNGSKADDGEIGSNEFSSDSSSPENTVRQVVENDLGKIGFSGFKF